MEFMPRFAGRLGVLLPIGRGEDTARHRQHHLPFVSKLDGVTQQVDQNLTEAGNIAHQRFWQFTLDDVCQVQPLGRCFVGQ